MGISGCSIGIEEMSLVTYHLLTSPLPTTSTYDHRLKRIGHPVRSTIHKLAYPVDNSLNRANRHSAESGPLAA
jgi:hypothetical protein